MHKNTLVDRLIDEKVPLHKWKGNVSRRLKVLERDMDVRGGVVYYDSQGLLTCRFSMIELSFLHNDQILLPAGKIPPNSGKLEPLRYVRSSSFAVPVVEGVLPGMTAKRATSKFFVLPGGYDFADFNGHNPRVIGPMFSEEETPGLRVIHILYDFDWQVPRKICDAFGLCRDEAEGNVSYRWTDRKTVKQPDMSEILEA